MKKLICFLVVCSFLFTGCFSTPSVKRDKLVSKGDVTTYDVVIDEDYHDNPAEFQYAVNDFVKDRGGKSYNIEKIGSNDFLITIPGETLVIDDLPKPRHFHIGRTLAIAIPVTAVVVGTIILADLAKKENSHSDY